MVWKLWVFLTESLKIVYTFSYYLIYTSFSLFVKKRDIDTVFIITHSNNIKNYFTLYPDERFVFFTTNNNVKKIAKKQSGCIKIISSVPWTIFQQIYYIIRAKKIVIDDYYGPLYTISRSKVIWNIWHSYAIYKKIGLDAPLYAKRNRWAIRRFYRNYQRTNCFFARSEIERDIFAISFKIARAKIKIQPELYTSSLPQGKKDILKEKIVVYAPTHRPYSYDYNKVYRFLETTFPEYKVIPVYHQLTVKNSKIPLDGYQIKNTVDNALKAAEIFVTDYSGLLIEVDELVTTTKVVQLIDVVDYEEYSRIQGLNDSYYPNKIEKLYFR